MNKKGYLLDTHTTPYIKSEPHKDQFDRIIISQAIAEGLTVISADTVFPRSDKALPCSVY